MTLRPSGAIVASQMFAYPPAPMGILPTTSTSSAPNEVQLDGNKGSSCRTASEYRSYGKLLSITGTGGRLDDGR
jgi:hypothetical protein